MTIKELKRFISDKGGFIISEGTLKTEDLLAATYAFLVIGGVHNKTFGKMRSEICKLFDGQPTPKALFYGESSLKDDEAASEFYNWDVFNFMNGIAPDGYYFGSSEGDGACIGFFAWEE